MPGLARAWNRQRLGDTIKHTTTSACGRARRMDSALTSVQCKAALHSEHNESRAEPAACFPSKIRLVCEINIASECIMLCTWRCSKAASIESVKMQPRHLVRWVGVMHGCTWSIVCQVIWKIPCLIILQTVIESGTKYKYNSACMMLYL